MKHAVPPAEVSLRRFGSPRYWPTWALWLCMRALSALPLRMQIKVGKLLARPLLKLKARERRTAERNLAACFPELAPDERDELLLRHFQALGASFAEMATGWCWPIEKLLRIVRIEGREHLDRALGAGKGAILMAAHFTTLEVGVSVLQVIAPRVSCMYRPQRNALLDALIRRGRSRFAPEQIPRDDVRGLIRKLKAGYAVVYLPDQTYLGNQAALLPFFGVPAMTNVATSKLARISGAPVLPYFCRRLPDDSGYVVDIGPPVPDFPSDDPAADTRKLVALLEDYIRTAPEQYLWIYKKFKGRPPPYPDLYAK
ncbi:MAG TPA: lipid A biosynthesis lauroyl acyltransferase [Gammaproteobacteria bacterium]